MQLLAETHVGPYAVTSVIGSGGMGDVYRARDLRLDRDVALKVLSESVSGSKDVVGRFQREAKAIASLSHPNIVAIYDCGFDRDLFYIATELLEGQTLREWAGSQKVPWRRAVKIAAAVADALRSAHSKGIVHRDLKPDNIFITRDGMVKILDFGLAHVSLQHAPSGSHSVTTPGAIMGTVGYMPPEQVRGEEIGPYTDIFALGCVLYEMLSGRKPFERRSAAETMSAILRDEPPGLRRICPDVPEAVVLIVEHCLEKEPQMRFQSSADLLFALEAAAESNGSHVKPRNPPQHARVRAISAILVVIALAGVIFFGRRAARQVPPPSAAVTSLAVMPLVNETGDESLEYLADGLTETIINDLSPVAGLMVSSRNSVFQYKGKAFDARDVRNELGVDALVTGRMRKRANSLQVSVELIDARNNRQIWGHGYEPAMRNVSEIEHELSSNISDTLQLQLSGKDKMRMARAPNPEAWSLYQQGLYEFNKRSPDALLKGIDFFRRSLAIDARYAPAYAGIADSYVLLGGTYEAMPPREAMPKAREAALQALKIDDTLADAHASLALILHEYDWNWPAAEQEFQRAIALNPNYVAAHQWYGQALLYRSRTRDGLQQLRRAEQLDPLSLLAKNDLAQAYWISGDFDAAIADARKVMEIEPRFWLAHWMLGLALAGKGDLPAAATSLEEAVALGGTPAVKGSLAYVYARSGRRSEALGVLRELEQVRRTRYISPAAFVMTYGALGDLDRAYAEVERAVNERAGLITAMNVAPIVEPIRRDPRYPALARRVGLPPLP